MCSPKASEISATWRRSCCGVRSWSCSLQVSRVIRNHFIFSFLMSEGFGDLRSLTSLNLSGHDERGSALTSLPESKFSLTSYLLFLILEICSPKALVCWPTSRTSTCTYASSLKASQKVSPDWLHIFSFLILEIWCPKVSGFWSTLRTSTWGTVAVSHRSLKVSRLIRNYFIF